MTRYTIATKLTNEIVEEATEYRVKNRVEPIDLLGYKEYLETGERLTFEQQYFDRRKQLNVLALDVFLRKSEESLPLLEEVIFQICNEYSWALPAHIPIVDDSFSCEGKIVIDLFAAETAQTLAEIIEIIGEQLSNFMKQLVSEEIERRVFTPFEERDWHWERLENNWSSVIAGCIGLTALSALLLHSTRQKQILQRLETSFAYYLKSFAEDGVCTEGVGYWAYGFGYYCYFAEKYTHLYQDDRYINDPKVKSIATFPFYAIVSKDQYIPYSDSNHHLVLPSGLLCFCEKTFDVAIPPVTEASSLYDDHCYRWAPMYRNLIWTKEANHTNIISCKHYLKDAQWAIIRNSEKQFIFSAKGGSNQESHNHNDIGHFIIGNDCDLFLTDLGAGEYTRDYFGEKRYTFLPNRALGHSLPIIQGKEQKEGNFQARDSHFQMIDGHTSTFSFELAETYPDVDGLQFFKRKWIIDEQQKYVLLEDTLQFGTDEQAIITENFVSLFKPSILNNQIVWQGKDNIFILQFDQSIDTPKIIEEIFSNHHGIQTKVYLIQLESKQKNKHYIRRYSFRLQKLV
ncbi:heparinase II/III family protein [Bacillus sp. SD088]|uniref:heparinase II/III family protein n=1 Tax=Bacillus sp. SD088 TaxID=2782012 RepID=UPI001A96DD9C|nr:heparinase II/III family protein [Bacillus sp. SD088]MBO0994728.1 heparinase II/III family protein [Bacillus sp. SD088]